MLIFTSNDVFLALQKLQKHAATVCCVSRTFVWRCDYRVLPPPQLSVAAATVASSRYIYHTHSSMTVVAAKRVYDSSSCEARVLCDAAACLLATHTA